MSVSSRIQCLFVLCVLAFLQIVNAQELLVTVDTRKHHKHHELRAKRGAHGLLIDLDIPQDVCETRITREHRPAQGHLNDGSRVEIQQDEEREFVATFVECASEHRTTCKGIDTKRFTSECATVYEVRAAHIRLVGEELFQKGLIRVPIACTCRIRKLFEL